MAKSLLKVFSPMDVFLEILIGFLSDKNTRFFGGLLLIEDDGHFMDIAARFSNVIKTVGEFSRETDILFFSLRQQRILFAVRLQIRIDNADDRPVEIRSRYNLAHL